MARWTFVALRRAILAAIVLVAMGFAIAAFVTPSAQAAPGGSCTYYSNSNYSTVVGRFGYDCCNNYIAWGKKSQYPVCGGCFVCYPPNP